MRQGGALDLGHRSRQRRATKPTSSAYSSPSGHGGREPATGAHPSPLQPLTWVLPRVPRFAGYRRHSGRYVVASSPLNRALPPLLPLQMAASNTAPCRPAMAMARRLITALHFQGTISLNFSFTSFSGSHLVAGRCPHQPCKLRRQRKAETMATTQQGQSSMSVLRQRRLEETAGTDQGSSDILLAFLPEAGLQQQLFS